jgi:hypothetical protein
VHLSVFRLPHDASACTVARGLQRQGLTARAGVRHHLAYLTVRSDRTDLAALAALVRALEPTAVPVNVEHLPRPLPHDVALIS